MLFGSSMGGVLPVAAWDLPTFVCMVFRAERGKTIHNEHEAYRSTEGAIRQLRTSYFYHGIPLLALQATSGIQATVSYHAVAGNIPQMRATA